MDRLSWGPHRGKAWTAGAWSAELRDDEIADLRYRGVLVARSLRAVVRDRNWATVPVSVLTTSSHDRGTDLGAPTTTTTVLGLRYDGYGIAAEADLALRDEGDHLVIDFALTATRAFDTNRTGLVLLHPPHVAGIPLRITHSDGTKEHTHFPTRISPHQPAVDIRQLEWSTDGLDVTALFHGDRFEMEDQRNWTDASFKTYSRPLALPFPYPLRSGEAVTQRIELRAEPTTHLSAAPTAFPTPSSSTTRRTDIRLVDAGRPAPTIGVCAARHAPTGDQTPPPADVILVEVEEHDVDPGATLARAAARGRPLDVRLIVDTPARVVELVAIAAPLGPLRMSIFSSTTHVTEPDLWEALLSAIDDLGVHTEVVGGARSHFTELNRTHQRLPEFPAWTISITPQMHARDTFQVEESIAMQRRVVADAMDITQGAPLHVGPITLRPRFNAVTTTPIQTYDTTADPATVDARQTEPHLASWTIASAAANAEGGAASITWFEDRGSRGIIDDDGTPFPVRDAISAVHALSGQPLLLPATTSPDGTMTWVLGVRTTYGARILISRLGDTPDDVLIDIDGHEIFLSLEPGTWQAIDVDLPPHNTKEHSC